MSGEDPHHTNPNVRTAPAHKTTVHKGGGNGWKWAAGAGVAALLVGLGYVAMTGDNTPNDTDQYAYSDESMDPNSPNYAGPLPANEDSDVPAAETASTDAAPAAASSSTAARRSTSTRTQTARADEPVEMEQTIGVGANNSVELAQLGETEEPVVVEGRRVIRPNWTRTPSTYRINAAYPERALERGREGEARVRCTVLETGRLDCASVSEYPANAGFGRAAVRVAEYFRHDTVRVDGAPATGTPVNLRVLFRMEEEDRRRG